MDGLTLSSEMLSWLKSYNFNPPFNANEMFKLYESIATLQQALPHFGSFTELENESYLNLNLNMHLNQMVFQDPTADEIAVIRYCVRNYNEWSKALASIWEINQSILARTGTTFPFEFKRIEKLLEGLFHKLMGALTSPKSTPPPPTPPSNVNFVNVHSIPGITTEYSNVQKATLLHQKLTSKIGQGIFEDQKIQKLLDTYTGDNYMSLHEVLFNALEIENHLIQHNKVYNADVSMWLLKAMEYITFKMDTEYEMFHDTLSFVLDSIGPLPLAN